MYFKSDIDVNLIQCLSGDHMVVAAAKVSTVGTEALSYSQSEKSDDNYGLINYLMKHRHGTPFEHNSMTFFIHAPICVWREWHRHRVGFSYNEESGRYKTLDPVFYLPPRDRPMVKVDKWKPGRPKFLPCSSDIHYNRLCDNLGKSYKLAYEMYKENLDMGFDPGLSRDCLPVGIFSGCWVTCNARSLMAFLSLRTHESNADRVSYPLWEIERAARKCEDIFAENFPLTYKAFNENGRVAP